MHGGTLHSSNETEEFVPINLTTFSDFANPFWTQAAQAHYRNADVTLACERCCVTNGYLQRLVWDRSVFLKRDKKCYVFK